MARRVCNCYSRNDAWFNRLSHLQLWGNELTNDGLRKILAWIPVLISNGLMCASVAFLIWREIWEENALRELNICYFPAISFLTVNLRLLVIIDLIYYGSVENSRHIDCT